TRDAKWGESVGAQHAAPLPLGLCGTVCSWQHSNLDVAEGDHVAVVLQPDVALRTFAELRMRLELARRDPGIPVPAAELVFEQLRTVEPVFHMIAVHDESRRIPLAAGMDVPLWRGIQVVGGARRRHGVLTVGVFR